MTQATNRADKILVVDDDARIRDLLRRYLTQEGFEVMVAEDGKALNRILLRDTVDLIVLDLMMPGEDGLSICRRPPHEAPGAPSGENESVTFGPFTFDMGTRTLHRNGEELPLTTGEFAMLKALVRHPRQPLSREKLALLARGREFEPFDRSLDVQVSRLRKLVEVDAAAPRYIQTVWGVGYVFVPDGTN